MFQTHDGGSTWLPVSLPSLPSQWGTELTRSTISFITPRLGWLLQSICVMPICHFWLSKTNDGGETWEPVANSGSDQKGNFPSPMRPGDEIFFLDQQHGWFIDSVYSNYETKDGGKTWDYSEITLGGGPTINQLHMFTPLEGIAAYSGGVFNVVKTRDGGKHWDAIYPPLEPTTNMQFFNERQGFGTTSETGPKTLISTQDGGETWQKVRELPCDTYFIDMMAGWGICDFSKSEERKLGSKPELYHTKDGGKSWQPIETPSELVTISFQFIDDRTGFVWDHWSHLLGTADGGRTWKPIQLDQSKFPLAQEQGGWVLVENKGIYHASPGDSTWQMVLRLQSVLYFDPVSPQVAWVSGFDKVYGLTLQKTMDGGKTWLQFRLEGINDRSDAWFTFAFIDDMRGWLRTRQGLFRTTDGGLTWNQIIPLLLP